MEAEHRVRQRTSRGLAWPAAASSAALLVFRCQQLGLAWLINAFCACHLPLRLIHTICARPSWPRLTACCLRLIKGICSQRQAGFTKASPTCLAADPFACPQVYTVGSASMEEDMYLDLFLDPYTIQVSLVATSLRNRVVPTLGESL